MSDTTGAQKLSWAMRLRRALARLLATLFESEPAGGLVPDRQFAIDDGVNYGLPLVLPGWATAEQKEKLIKAAVAEANAQYGFQFDRPNLYSENLSQFPTADPLREWDHQTRREVISRSHLAHERNPMANAAVEITTLFAMGDGLTISYRNADVEALLEAFRANEENAVERYEKQFCSDLQVDGELFIRFFSEAGSTVIVSVPPWEIDWIRCERGFKRRPQVYHRLGEESNGEPGDYEHINAEIPADEILHVAINNHAYETRGRPELFRILPWLKAYKDWLEGRARQNHWRGGLLWDVTLKGATPGQVAAKRAQYKQPPSPGSLVIHNDNEMWGAIENKVGASDVSEDGRQIKLMGAVGKKLPEYMLSDGENANLASATAQQLPALRMFSDFQDILVGQVWKPIYKRVIENAITAGILDEWVEEHDAEGDPILDDAGQPTLVRAVEAFSLSAPELESTDPKNLSEAMAVAEQRGWASRETAATRMGFDYRLEQKKIAREESEKEQAAMQGRGPGALPDENGPTLNDFNMPMPTDATGDTHGDTETQPSA